MANPEKSGFSNAAMEGYSPEHQPQGHYPQEYGMNPPPQQQGGAMPPPYVTQPQYGAQAPPTLVYNQYGGPPMIVTAQPVRETGTPPDTSCSLIVSILSIFFCVGAWPFAVVAIIFNRKAKGQADLGQYTTAKNTLRTCFIFIGVTVVLGIIAWIIFAIRLKAALSYLDNLNHRRHNGY